MNPIYTQRRNTTYAMDETNLMNLSASTGQSTRLYAFGSYALGLATNVLVSYGGVPDASLNEIGKFLLHRGFLAFLCLGLVLYLFARNVSRDRSLLLDQIRRECGVDPPKRLLALAREAIAYQLSRLTGPKR